MVRCLLRRLVRPRGRLQRPLRGQPPRPLLLQQVLDFRFLLGTQRKAPPRSALSPQGHCLAGKLGHVGLKTKRYKHTCSIPFDASSSLIC